MSDYSLQSKVISGLFWKMLERGWTLGLQLVIQIVLTRLLVPTDYGVIALLTVYISIATIFVQSGLNTALIQTKNVDSTDYSTVFYSCLCSAVIFYFIMFFTAPYISNFFNQSQMVIILRMMSITLFFNAVNTVQTAIISREMKFKFLFQSSIGAILFSGSLGIILAYNGFGIWALVWQQITNQISITIILWFRLMWRPKLCISIVRLKKLYSYSWKLLCASLLDIAYNSIYTVVIGRVFNPQILGYFNRGDQVPNILVTNINGSIQSVLLPVLSSNQDHIDKVKSITRRAIMNSSFVIFPLMIVLIVVAEPLVKLTITDKWLPCVPFLQMMCVAYAFWPIHTANLQAINAIGRSDIYLKLEIVKKIIGIMALFFTIPFGVYVMVAFIPITSVICSFVNAWPNRHLLNYSYSEQWKDIMPALGLSLITGLSIYALKYIGMSQNITLTFQFFTGTILYLGLAYALKFESFNYLLSTIKALYFTR